MPEHKEAISANTTSYVEKLKALDVKTKASLAELAPDKRTVVTAYDASRCLAEAYSMNFLSPVGIDSEAVPSAKNLAKLIAQIKSDGAAALFMENISNPVLIQQISDETGSEIGSRLFSDTLSERGGPATSYLAMFEHNLGTLIVALN